MKSKIIVEDIVGRFKEKFIYHMPNTLEGIIAASPDEDDGGGKPDFWKVDTVQNFIRSEFHTLLDGLVEKCEGEKKNSHHPECVNGNHEPCDTCTSKDVFNRALDRAIAIIRSAKGEK